MKNTHKKELREAQRTLTFLEGAAATAAIYGTKEYAAECAAARDKQAAIVLMMRGAI